VNEDVIYGIFSLQPTGSYTSITRGYSEDDVMVVGIMSGGTLVFLSMFLVTAYIWWKRRRKFVSFIGV
jgi:hypoxanthine-guanine phosphoribosyltransferase